VLDAWNSLAQACIRLGRWDEARNAANTAIRLAPNDETANANLAESLAHR
jgi:Flp pilus assembly protein TadD